MPKFGELVDTDVWAVASRTLTDFSAEEIFDLPAVDDHYGNIYVSSSATADTFGSSTQASADVGTGKRLILVIVTSTSATRPDSVEIEFRDAANGGGNLVGRVLMGQPHANHAFVFPVFIALADSSALHVRAKDTEALAITYKLAVHIA